MKRVKVITFLLCLFVGICAMPANAQELVDVLEERNQNLRDDILSLKRDTLALSNTIADLRKELEAWNAEVAVVDAQVEVQKEKIRLLDDLKQEKSAVLARHDSMEMRKKQLYDLRAEKLSILRDAQNNAEKMEAATELKQRETYAQNRALLDNRYSLIMDDELAMVHSTVDNFVDMDGFAEYKQRVEYAYANKKLYNRAVELLNSPYNQDDILQVSDQLYVLLEQEKDDLASGRFKLNEAQYAEIDSLDIKLWRYKEGVKVLKSVVAKVNGDKAVAKYRKSRSKEACIDAIRPIVTLQGQEEVREYYFDMIPYLNKLWEDYWNELQLNPFESRTERLINQLKEE